MTYKITYTELNNPNKPPITVLDQSLDTSTSLTFVGQGYSGYAPILAADFLHLLENFANPTAPVSPVQGQLWYDNANALLKVYDGGQWTPAGAIKKSNTSPANSNTGDIWVNTATSQLYVYSGSSWILVGPQFSSGTQTGPLAEEIIDTSNTTHFVISFYSNNNRVAIVSQESFIPKQSLAGFANINKGINLYTNPSSVDPADGSSAGLWGTASSADALLINGANVASSNFLRGDVPSISNNLLSIRSNDGIKVGSDLSFQLKTTGQVTVFSSINPNNSVRFDLTNTSNNSNTILQLTASGTVGINTASPDPTTALDILGKIQTDTGLNVTGTTSGSITTAGGIVVARDSTFSGALTTAGKITVGADTGSISIQPTADAVHDIGSSSYRFRNIYAQNFVGDFSGTFAGYFTGAIDGSATQLANATLFSLAGDVTSNTISFNGTSLTGTATFNTILNSSFVTSKPVVTDSSILKSAFPDTLVVYQSSSQQLVQMTKDTFLSHVPTVPVGCILPFAGPASAVPSGYLLCDGSEVLQTTYSVLFQMIKYTYSNGTPADLVGANTFKLPDLRGRFPLGADNMNNNIKVPSAGNSNVLVTTVGTAANRVSEASADNIGAGSDSYTGPGKSSISLTTSQLPQHTHNLKSANDQYYAVGDNSSQSDTDSSTRLGYGITPSGLNRGLSKAGPVVDPATGATVTGQAINIMNPYLTINYIIYTGVNV